MSQTLACGLTGVKETLDFAKVGLGVPIDAQFILVSN